jgi:hypothetical protein
MANITQWLSIILYISLWTLLFSSATLSGVFQFLTHLTGLLGLGVPTHKKNCICVLRYVILMSEVSKMLTCPCILLKGKTFPKLHHQAMKECVDVEVWLINMFIQCTAFLRNLSRQAVPPASSSNGPSKSLTGLLTFLVRQYLLISHDYILIRTLNSE